MNHKSYVNAGVPDSSFHPIQGMPAKHAHISPVKRLSHSTVAPLATQPPLLQAKLTIGQPGDTYEREADSIAEKVMRLPEPALQRK